MMQEYIAGLPPWMLSLSVLALMVVVGLIAHYVVFAIAIRIARRSPRPIDELLVRHSYKPARLLLPLVFIILAWNAVPPAPEIAFVGQRVLAALFIAGI